MGRTILDTFWASNCKKNGPIAGTFCTQYCFKIFSYTLIWFKNMSAVILWGTHFTTKLLGLQIILVILNYGYH